MYIVGVDGGGTKTECMVFSPEEGVVAAGKSGSSNLRNVGVEVATENIIKAIEESFVNIERKEIKSLFVGIPAFAEEYKEKEEEIIGKLKELSIPAENISIGSDQEVAFRSGTDEKNGVVVISGTGSVTRGWNEGKDIKTSGWGFITDNGSGYSIGREAFKRVVNSLEGREERTVLTEMILKSLNAKNIEDLSREVYQKNHIEVLSSLSIITHRAAGEGDYSAEEIITLASKNLALATENTVKRLEFKEEFPLVVVGGMFKSDIFLNVFKEEAIKRFKMAKIIIPKDPPVKGAVKIALEKNA